MEIMVNIGEKWSNGMYSQKTATNHLGMLESYFLTLQRVGGTAQQVLRLFKMHQKPITVDCTIPINKVDQDLSGGAINNQIVARSKQIRVSNF